MNRFIFFVFFIFMNAFSVTSQEFSKIDASPLDFALFRPDVEQATPVARIIYSRPQ